MFQYHCGLTLGGKMQAGKLPVVAPAMDRGKLYSICLKASFPPPVFKLMACDVVLELKVGHVSL